jgi:hypothetical protein
MVKPKLPTVWALVGAAAGALVGIILAAVYVESILPGQLTGHSPDSDAGFVLVMLGGFLAMLGAGAGAPLAEFLYRRSANRPERNDP